MEPTRDSRATLVDLLDRVLDKGLVINADLVISVAGIPLIGVNLRAALAGMETMLKYGFMQAWDERERAWEREHRKVKQLALAPGEELIQRIFGSYYYSEGIYTAWRPGFFYLTNKRLFLFNQDLCEVIFQTPLTEITGLAVKGGNHSAREQKEELCLLLNSHELARLHTTDVAGFKQLIEEAMNRIGIAPKDNPALPVFEQRTVSFLTPGEKVIHQGKMWHLVAESATGRARAKVWKAGHLCLTNNGLSWWCDFDQKLAFQVPIDGILNAEVALKDLGVTLGNKRVLAVNYKGADRATALFSGDEDKLYRWEKALNKTIPKTGWETCPQCGREAPMSTLLGSGCARCGWVCERQAEAAIA